MSSARSPGDSWSRPFGPASRLPLLPGSEERTGRCEWGSGWEGGKDGGRGGGMYIVSGRAIVFILYSLCL